MNFVVVLAGAGITLLTLTFHIMTVWQRYNIIKCIFLHMELQHDFITMAECKMLSLLQICVLSNFPSTCILLSLFVLSSAPCPG